MNFYAEQRSRMITQPVDAVGWSAVKSFPETTKEHSGEVDGGAKIAGAGGGRRNRAPERVERLMVQSLTSL